MISNHNMNAIMELDLDLIKGKLMHVESGEGWSQEKVDAVEKEYRRFLYLVTNLPAEQASPLVDVDTFWHYHILDTMKYAADCEQAFGYFLHHYPYLGMGGGDNGVSNRDAGERMRDLYEAAFGESYIQASSLIDQLGSVSGEATAVQVAFCGATGATLAYCTAIAAQAAFCGATGVKPAAFCGASTAKTAFCGATGARAAFCGATGAKTAFCGATSAKTAFCGATSAKAAFCGATSAKTSFCGASNAKTSFCGATNAKTAFCGANIAKTAFCGANTAKTSFCGATNAKTAFCGATSVNTSFCGATSAKSAFCGATTASPLAHVDSGTACSSQEREMAVA